MEVHKTIGMVIGGRAARACDVCGHERARWYCAADEAYLCERCDSSVHSANAVAKRHDRVRLGPNGAPMKIERSSSGVVKRESSCGPYTNTRSANRSSRKRPRSIRHHPSHSKVRYSRSAIQDFSNSELAEVKVKAEPCSPGAEDQVPEHHRFENLFDSEKLSDDALLHEVPIYMSMDQELPIFDCSDLPEERPANESSVPIHVQSVREINDSDGQAMELPGPDNCIDIDCFLDEEGGDLCDLELDMSCIVGEDQGSPCLDGTNILSCCPTYAADELHHYASKDMIDYRSDDDYEEVCQNGESPRSWLCKVKVESPPPDLAASEFVDADAILGEKLDRNRVDGRTKLGLTLNFEDVLIAWSDRGSLWMDGQRPQMVPDESSLDYWGGLDTGLVPDLSFNGSCSTQSGEPAGQVPVIRKPSSGAKSEAREARVMRYKEKRRTRLFSKKIRYEVRKLNAEKRPRMKGRFVKRISPSIVTG